MHYNMKTKLYIPHIINSDIIVYQLLVLTFIDYSSRNLHIWYLYIFAMIENIFFLPIVLFFFILYGSQISQHLLYYTVSGRKQWYSGRAQDTPRKQFRNNGSMFVVWYSSSSSARVPSIMGGSWEGSFLYLHLYIIAFCTLHRFWQYFLTLTGALSCHTSIVTLFNVIIFYYVINNAPIGRR